MTKSILQQVHDDAVSETNRRWTDHIKQIEFAATDSQIYEAEWRARSECSRTSNVLHCLFFAAGFVTAILTLKDYA